MPKITHLYNIDHRYQRKNSVKSYQLYDEVISFSKACSIEIFRPCELAVF